MRIPNDTGHPYRLNKFIEYQHKAAPIDPTTLLAYARKEKLSGDEAVLLAFLHSAVYCEVTAIYLFETVDWKRITTKQLWTYWRENKRHLVFNSSRRYAKNMDWWPSIMSAILTQTGRQYEDWTQSYATYGAIREAVEKLPYTGHFASGRFMEPLLWFKSTKIIDLVCLKEPDQLSWRKSANETSGLLNLLYRDDEADAFDSAGKLAPEREPELDDTYRYLHGLIFDRHPDQIRLRCAAQGKLCSWRNLFKGRRYGGFHHDRQLVNLRHYEEAFGNLDLWYRLFQLRRETFPKELLGEVSGWDGLRKNRQRLWLDNGLTGVEKESLCTSLK